MWRWRFWPWTAAGVAAVSLGGCATQAVRTVDQKGAAPTGGQYVLAADSEAPTPPGLASAVDRRLARLSLAQSGEHPQFRVQAVFSERQGPVGAFNQVGPEGKPLWLASPAVVHWWSSNRRPRVRQLTVRILDAGSGAELYRATALEQGGKAGPTDWDRLAAAAIPSLPGAAAKAP